jgi:hypothetical protein
MGAVSNMKELYKFGIQHLSYQWGASLNDTNEHRSNLTNMGSLWCSSLCCLGNCNYNVFVLFKVN